MKNPIPPPTQWVAAASLMTCRNMNALSVVGKVRLESQEILTPAFTQPNALNFVSAEIYPATHVLQICSFAFDHNVGHESFFGSTRPS